ncbi:hypothetical protein [Nocardia xishanensis]
MTGFLAELGKKLAERWLELLVLPGALWVAATMAGGYLGHAHAVDVPLLRARLDQQAAQSRSAATLLLLVVAFLLVSAAAGLLASVLGGLVERAHALAGHYGAPRQLRDVRIRLWRKADRRYRRALAAAARATSPRARRAANRRVFRALARRQHLGDAMPTRPTWVADRFAAADSHLDTKYGVTPTVVWPRLWTLLPDALRADLGTARDAYSAGCRLIGWGVLYLLLGCAWWPALAVGAVAVITGSVRSRSAVRTLAELTVTAVDLHLADLAEHLGLGTIRPPDRAVGERIMNALR